MKIVTAGLISFCFSIISCVSVKPKNPDLLNQNLELNLMLSSLPQDARFDSSIPDRFTYKNTEEMDVKVFKHSFNSQNELMGYLLNRRMLLHRTTQEDIAPYFGIIQNEKSCLEKIDVKSDIIKIDKNTDFVFMAMPVNANKAVSDCHEKNIWGLMRYYFYNCKIKNELFEIRQATEIDRPVP